MKFKIEKLRIWQKAMDLAEIIDNLTFRFPDRERNYSFSGVVTSLHEAKRRRYIIGSEFDVLYDEAFNPMNTMTAFKRKIL